MVGPLMGLDNFIEIEKGELGLRKNYRSIEGRTFHFAKPAHCSRITQRLGPNLATRWFWIAIAESPFF
jgi:hypothetical protein